MTLWIAIGSFAVGLLVGLIIAGKLIGGVIKNLNEISKKGGKIKWK